ncbi:MAG TPA: DUF4129 domain-containing protein [Mycobacterium sp.]|nr:DUF4129 domain-containing protein [Mycobacterium sp.]
MPGIDKATGRVIALIVLLVLTAAALRGYLPGAERVPRQQATGSPAALIVLVVLLGGSLVIVATAIITRVRNRHAVPGSMGALSAGLGGGKGRPRWRVLLIGLMMIAAWLFFLWLLRRWVGHHDFGQLTLVPGGHTGAGTDTAPSPTSTAPRPQRPQPTSGGDMFGYLAATAVGMLLLTVAAAVIAGHSRRSGAKPAGLADRPLRPAAPVAGPESLVRAAELGLAEVGEPGREPREAIIACYATMERELAHVPDAAPQDFDTPTEVLARAVEHHALPADNAIQLVSLFAEARFSPHVMTERHRQDAVRVLELVLTE